MNKRLIKIAILSVSLLTVMAGAAVSPALADIALAFPESNETTIKLILTLPSVMIIPFIFVSSYLTTRFSKKSILFIGILFYLIGGIGGGLVSTIELLLLCRAILGIGVGLMMPISTSLVADFFDGEERTATMGQVSAANNLGGVGLFLMSGVLAAISWRVAFFVYILALVSAIIVYFHLPKTKSDGAPSGNFVIGVPKKIYGFGLSALFIVLIFFAIPVNMALYMQQEGIGSSQLAGVIISVGTMAGFIAGLLLARIRRLLQNYFTGIQLLIMAIGFFTLSFSNHLIIIALGVGITGYGFGSILPTVFDQVTREVPRSETVQAMAIVTSMLFLGQFISPLVLDGIGMVFGNETVRFLYQFLASAILLVAATFLALAIKVSLSEKREVLFKSMNKKDMQLQKK
ncbi:MFS transporter [Alkalihalobacillus sp. BA299]|uniref:MFS transporter n=1 Tax=Alkalihalobacillus sp. BA299 TaxID=2815938 RepID=UPI001ADC590E|nr:MFS transporter [Alkalihalobacillus sp. BA299]